MFKPTPDPTLSSSPWRIQRIAQMFNVDVDQVLCLKLKVRNGDSGVHIFMYGDYEAIITNSKVSDEKFDLFFSESYFPPCTIFEDGVYLVHHETGPEFFVLLRKYGIPIAAATSLGVKVSGDVAIISENVLATARTAKEIAEVMYPAWQWSLDKANLAATTLQYELRTVAGVVVEDFKTRGKKYTKKDIENIVAEYLKDH